MNRTIVINKLKEIILRSIKRDDMPDGIEDANMINELGINSIDALEILIWIEDTFNLQIPDEDLNSELLVSMNKLADYIVKKTSE
jgi:acyl carrier protein